MNRDDIIRWAREVGCEETRGMDAFRFTIEELEGFAATVAAAERRACADCLNFHGEEQALGYLEWKWANGRSKGQI